MITAQSVTSLPVPEVVGTVTTGGMRRSIGSWPHSYCAMEPPCSATTPTALATSIGEPPPTATSPSQLLGGVQRGGLVHELDVRVGPYLGEHDRVDEGVEDAAGDAGRERRPRP